MVESPTSASFAGRLLQAILEQAGEPPADASVRFHGADPVFPTPLRIGDMGAATIAAAALQAARLWLLRGGQPQELTVDVDAAAAAMRSSRYLQPDSPPQGPARVRAAGGGLGVYRTRDGRWFYFQRLFEHHRRRQCDVLGCEDEQQAIAQAVAGWEGAALEEAIAQAGAAGAMVRSHGEWSAHAQAQALARLPLFEILRFADAPSRPLPPAERPLSGVRVLDLTRVLAGPTCARTLAEHGASVLRIGTPRFPDNEQMMQDTGHGKRSAVLDLTQEREAARLRDLVAGADVFVQGYRPGALDALGFSPREVAKHRPGIVYVSLSAWGHEGPWSRRRGFDSVVQAASGIADELAVDGVPRFAPANPLDYATGYLAAFAAMVALARRAHEGGSYLVRVSLAQTGRWLCSLPRVERERYAAQPPDLPPQRLEALMATTQTPFGRLRHLAPCARLSLTPGRWDLPSVPLDHDPPEWW